MAVRDDIEALVRALEQTCNDMHGRLDRREQTASERKKAILLGAAIALAGVCMSATVLATHFLRMSRISTDDLMPASTDDSVHDRWRSGLREQLDPGPPRRIWSGSPSIPPADGRRSR